MSAATVLVHGCPMYGMTGCQSYLNLQACYCINEAGIASLQLAHLLLQALQHTKAVMNGIGEFAMIYKLHHSSLAKHF